MYRHCRVALALLYLAMAYSVFAQGNSDDAAGESESASLPAAFDTYIIQSGDSLYGIAQRFNTTVETLMAVNSLSGDGRIIAGQALLIPAAEEPEVEPYEVQPGDSLFSISRRFNTTVGRLQELNQLGDSSEIIAGQTIAVPAADESSYEVYVVAEADSLLSIAERYGADVSELIALNEIADEGELTEGQTILVPRIDDGKFAAHVVRSGDTLYDISRLYNTTVAQLRSLNDIEDGDGLTIGRSIIVPRVDETLLDRYVVRSGDSLYSIASQLDVDLPVLQELNQLADVRDIQIGRALLIPKREGTALKIHVVRPGDTLEEIAEMYETTVAVIQSLNGIADPSLISLETAIVVPEAKEILARPEFGFGIQIFVEKGRADELAVTANSLGVDWVKIDVAWADIETAPAVYSFSALDAMIAAMDLAGLKIMLTVYDAPAWSRSSYIEDLNSQFKDYTGPPEVYDDFVPFLANLVTRYAGLVDAYEIWKSPNLVKFWTVPEYTRPRERTDDGDYGIPDKIRMGAGYYVPLLELAYSTIKSHDEKAIVVAAGLAPAGYGDNYNAIDTVTFLNNMLDAGAADFSDAIGAIFSASAVPPTLQCCDKPPGVDTHYESFLQYFGDILSFYDETLKEHDAELPVMVTQLGWGTTDGANLAVPSTGFEWLTYTSEDEQAVYITQAYGIAQNLDFVDSVFLYNLNGCAVGDEEACFFSLEDADGQLRPAFEAFRSVPKQSEST
ncbi:MAG: LysM peptidoglycan-binding domain-containing protein [Chloroflexi bacterium]|nr:LysM peptidoglycan-binding domain-containing protein [Chloroflexota bacterium]